MRIQVIDDHLEENRETVLLTRTAVTECVAGMGIGEQNSFFQASQGLFLFPVWIQQSTNLETEISDEYDLRAPPPHRKLVFSYFYRDILKCRVQVALTMSFRRIFQKLSSSCL